MEEKNILDEITKMLLEKIRDEADAEEQQIDYIEEEENRERGITIESVESILRFTYTEEFTKMILAADTKALKKERKEALKNLKENLDMLRLPLSYDEIGCFENMAAEDRHLIKIIDFLIEQKNV